MMAGDITEKNGIRYFVDGSAKVLPLEGVNNKYEGDIVIPYSITFDDHEYIVTAIGEEAFSGCTDLTSITLPEGLERIEYMAFYGCTGLTSITIPEGVTEIKACAFRNCIGLSSLTIPTGVVTIWTDAFEGCTGLQSVIIPETVTKIYSNVFKGCSGLGSITVHPDNPAYDSRNGCNALIETATNTLISGCKNTVIPKTVTGIGKQSFFNCIDLTSIIISDNITSIANDAFEGCSNLDTLCWGAQNVSPFEFKIPIISSLKHVIIEDGITTIPNRAFEGCNNIKSIKIPSSVRIIESSAFACCTNLKRLIIPEGVTTIGQDAFGSCDSLKTLSVPNSVTILTNAFRGSDNIDTLYWNTNLSPASIVNEKLRFASLGNSVTAIPDQAFIECLGLSKITLPDGLTRIGDQAFYQCGNLTSFRIPDTVTEIGEYALANCRKLSSLIIPNSVTNIGSGAFAGCNGLTNTMVIPKSVKEMGESVFYGCNGIDSLFWYSQASPYWFENSNLKYLYIGEGPESINKDAFKDCTKLTNVTIPSSITSIEHDSFYSSFQGCSNIDTLYWNSQLPTRYLIDHCNSNIKCVILGDNVSIIHPASFQRCTRLDSISIPSHITRIEQNAFLECSCLTAMNIPDGVKIIGSGAFSLCVNITSLNIPNSVDSIGRLAFSSLNSLVSLSVPNNVKFIDDEAFSCPNLETLYWDSDITPRCVTRSCSNNLKHVSLGKNMTVIGPHAFETCSLLTSIDLPPQIKEIDDYAFSECTGLTSILFPDGLIRIGNYAFYDCIGFKSINIPEGVQTIGNCGLCCNGYTTLYMPSSVKHIGKAALRGPVDTLYWNSDLSPHDLTRHCFNELKYVSLGDDVTIIADSAFMNCYYLPELIIPEGVTTIGKHFLFDCGMRSIVLPSSITSIADEAFYHCYFSDIYTLSAIPCTITDQVFYPIMYTGATLHVPQGTEDAYRNAEGWKNFNRITSDPTRVHEISDDTMSEPIPVGYYDLTGKKLDVPRQGINIIRYNDGSVRKLIINY